MSKMLGQGKELDYPRLRDSFRYVYMVVFDTPTRQRVDLIMRDSIPFWELDKGIYHNLGLINDSFEEVIPVALLKVRLIYISFMADKLSVLFAPIVPWTNSWPHLINRQKVKKYRVARTCPITGNILKWPARFNTCRHVECFEHSISHMVKRCPFCDTKGTSIVVDTALKVVYDNVPEIAGTVVLWEDFSWTFEPEQDTRADAFYKGQSGARTYFPNTFTPK